MPTVVIRAFGPDGAELLVQTGSDIKIPGSALKNKPQRLAKPGEDNVPTTWAEWQAMYGEAHPLAQIRDTDPQGRRFIYDPIPNNHKPVQGGTEAGDENNQATAAREFAEETGLNLRATPARFTGLTTGTNFRVDLTAAEVAQISQTLRDRIAAKEKEIFDFVWRLPPGPRGRGRKTRRRQKRYSRRR